MSDRFPYPGDNSIIIQDGSIIWNDQSHDQSSLQYMDANDTIINDSTINESYATATDSNETQYFSILEQSNDITLEDLHNLTIGNTDVQENIVSTEDVASPIDEETTQESKDEDDFSQVIVFTVDGSDDLYGIQLTQDEEGNIQKYQFKFRSTANGQLEAIPESIELLPNDEPQTTDTEESGEFEQTEPQEYFLVQPVNSENQETQQVEDNQKEVEMPRGRDLIKGERHSPSILEESMETENFIQEDSLQASDGLVQQEEQEETTENRHIKSEIMERTSQEQDDELQAIHSVDIKVEHFTGGDEYQEEEEEELDETIQPQGGEFEDIQQTHVIKEQPPDAMSEEEIDQDQSEIIIGHQLENIKKQSDQAIEEEEIEDTVQNPLDQQDLVQQFIHENCQIEVEYDAESEDQERSSQQYQLYNVQEDPKEYAEDYSEEPDLNANQDSDSEQYQIVEGLHITGEINDEPHELLTTSDSEPVLHEVIERYKEQNVERTNILKHSIVSTNKDEKSKKPFVSVKYYVVYPEKENVNLADDAATQISVPKSSRPNPRSVLRTSFMKPKEEKHDKEAKNFPECDLFHKRFAKNKEAMRAKLFHNFLNRTTIPHAPVRQQRQPRKQEIKPVIERSDEEIIVQEVMVSSNGFVESLNKKMRNKLQVTAVVELSDSEDEANLKRSRHRRKAQHIPRKSSESELSVIEIHSEDETDLANLGSAVKRGKGRPKKRNTEGETLTLKRRRGRPPKNKVEGKLTVIELSPRKRNRTHSEEVKPDQISTVLGQSEISIDKEEVACPKCPKTFPSKNSLNTHIYHHNLENRLKNKTTMSLNPRQTVLPKMEYNHKCLICQQTFRNTILLQRHSCIKKQNSLNCSVCLKQFRDVAMFNIHKKTHIKSNLVANTSIVKISPRKSLSRSSSSLMKPPKTKSIKSLPSNVFKCKQCLKVCDSEQSLVAHTKIHKKFLCSSCSATFSSRLLLDTHVRTNCVKLNSPLNKRLSFQIKKSFIHTPPKRVSVCNPPEKRRNTRLSETVPLNQSVASLNQSVASLNLECDICHVKFATFRVLYTHKVQKHGLDTPDKSLLSKPKQRTFKPRAAHGGIPASDRMKRAYAALREKLAEMQEHSDVAQ